HIRRVTARRPTAWPLPLPASSPPQTGRTRMRKPPMSDAELKQRLDQIWMRLEKLTTIAKEIRVMEEVNDLKLGRIASRMEEIVIAVRENKESEDWWKDGGELEWDDE